MNVRRYRERDRNQLANCMLLTAQENGAGGKSDTPPDQWFVGERATDSYLSMHLIPPDPALWKLERFDDFITERKKLIPQKFAFLLVSADRQGLSGVQSPAETAVERQKSLSKLIDAGLIAERSPLVLRYRGQQFSGIVRRNGIELTDGLVYAPSAAAVRCYANLGFPRPTENGWRVWKTTEGASLDELYEQLGPTPSIDDL